MRGQNFLGRMDMFFWTSKGFVVNVNLIMFIPCQDGKIVVTKSNPEIVKITMSDGSIVDVSLNDAREILGEGD